jgi:putative toxin-antitoxin system antitoxin component (TIGR02293 family)
MSDAKAKARLATKSRTGTARRKNPTAKSARRHEAERGTTSLPPTPSAWWKTLLMRERAIGSIYGVAPIDRIGLVRDGVPVEAMAIIARDMGIAKLKLYATLGMSRATIERKARQNHRLTRDEGERVVGIARLIGQVEQIVHQSGNPLGFDAARWFAAWLSRPLPALGGVLPESLMDTAEGREIVSGLIAQIQSGAYA